MRALPTLLCSIATGALLAGTAAAGPSAGSAAGTTAAGSSAGSADLAPPAADPAAYGDRILVILSSKLEPGVVPDGLAAAAALPGAAPARLDSTAYKNLMPCYEVVVAAAFTDKAQARALSARLRAAGVDHYLKPAGPYVGARPELDAACAARRAPPALSQVVGFVDPVGAVLPLDAALSAHLLADAPAVRALDAGYGAWAASLPVRTVDRWTRGQALRAVSYDQGLATCALDDFAVGVVGAPHFGVLQGDRPPSQPTCGSPAVYARLSCAADLVLLTDQPVTVGTWTGPEQELSTPPPLPAGWQQPVIDALAAGRALADERGVALHQRWSTRPLQWADQPARLLQVEIETGEGEWWCGGPDHHQVLAGVLTVQGDTLVPLTDITLHRVHGLLAPQGQPPSLHLADQLTGSQRLVGGALQAELAQAYCDCPC